MNQTLDKRPQSQEDVILLLMERDDLTRAEAEAYNL